MTELGPLVVFAFLDSYKVGSVGKLVPNTDCKVSYCISYTVNILMQCLITRRIDQTFW